MKKSRNDPTYRGFTRTRSDRDSLSRYYSCRPLLCPLLYFDTTRLRGMSRTPSNGGTTSRSVIHSSALTQPDCVVCPERRGLSLSHNGGPTSRSFIQTSIEKKVVAYFVIEKLFPNAQGCDYAAQRWNYQQVILTNRI